MILDSLSIVVCNFFALCWKIAFFFSISPSAFIIFYRMTSLCSVAFSCLIKLWKTALELHYFALLSLLNSSVLVVDLWATLVMSSFPISLLFNVFLARCVLSSCPSATPPTSPISPLSWDICSSSFVIPSTSPPFVLGS